MFQLNESFAPAISDGGILEHSVGSLLKAQAHNFGDHQALQEILKDGTPGRYWTYSDLYKDACRLAIWLNDEYTSGEKVVVWSPNSPEWVLTEYACALAGLVLVTANPAFQTNELQYVLEQSGSVALFHVPEFRGNPMAQIAISATEKTPGNSKNHKHAVYS